jgi:dienelactone hydrolase
MNGVKFPLFLAAVVFGFPLFAAEIPRALPPGELPHDARLGPLKELDGYFPWTPPASREAWEQRAEQVRMQLRVALGLYPEPTKTPLNAVIHGRIEQDDYTVEKVFFESMPGFFVTGSLFRPKTPGPHPAVLCPHGHWRNARWAIRTDAEMKKELESGGELLAEGGRSMFQSLGVQLARLGIVALVYDMLGDCDSQQISYELAHKFSQQRPEMNTRENWGLFSPQAEAHAQSILGLQTWNSIRALDFLTSLPDVDAQRLGCTGASGGGTQTMLLGAIDSRLAVECPAVMVSTAMQGGCTCENASLLRIGTGNVEFAALFAPKPLGMTAANDWTKEMETKGFPELQKHYALLGAPQNVALWPHLNFGHNYNVVSRAHIYGWFNEHFHLGWPAGRLVEHEYPLLTKEQLTVWDAEHPAPPGGDDFERKLLKWWHEDAQAHLAKSPEELARIAEPGWKALIGWRGYLPTGNAGHWREINVAGAGKTYRAFVLTDSAEDGSFELPLIGIDPAAFRGRTALWLDEHGKAGLFRESGELRPEVCRLLEAGWRVEGVDLFEQGEFLADNQPVAQTRRTKNPREAAAFTFGYNPALFAQRVHDICQMLTRLGLSKEPTQRAILALDGTGPLAAAALAIFGEQIDAAVIQSGGFRFGAVLDLQSPNFLPAAAKYGDLPGALLVARSHTARLLVLGEGGTSPDPIDWLLESK